MGSYLSNIASRSNGIPDLTRNNFLMKPAGSSAGKKESDDVPGTEDDKKDLLQDSFLHSPGTNQANIQPNENKKTAISAPHIQKNIGPNNYLQMHVERNVVESSQKKIPDENQKRTDEQLVVAGADVMTKNEQGADLKSSTEQEVVKIPANKETILTEISSQHLVDSRLSTGLRLPAGHDNEKHNRSVIVDNKKYIPDKKLPEQKEAIGIRPAVHSNALLSAQQNKKSNPAAKLFIGRITIELVKNAAPVIKNNPVLRQHKSMNSGSKPVNDLLNKLRFGLEQM